MRRVPGSSPERKEGAVVVSDRALSRARVRAFRHTRRSKRQQVLVLTQQRHPRLGTPVSDISKPNNDIPMTAQSWQDNFPSVISETRQQIYFHVSRRMTDGVEGGDGGSSTSHLVTRTKSSSRVSRGTPCTEEETGTSDPTAGEVESRPNLCCKSSMTASC